MGHELETWHKNEIQYYIENPRVAIVLTIDGQTERPIFDTVERTVQNILETIYIINQDENDNDKGYNRILTFLFLFADDDENFQTDGENFDMDLFQQNMKKYKEKTLVRSNDRLEYKARMDFVKLKRSASAAATGVTPDGPDESRSAFKEQP
eukprot:12726112-Ditylum_brightwellii.AAC.1